MTPEERNELIARYVEGSGVVARSVAAFPREHLTERIIPGKWTACEIVQHLGDSEMRAALRLRRLLTEERPLILAYDQDAYATRLRYNQRTDLDPALDALRGARATTAQLLSSMGDEEWQREGEHPEHPRYTAETWLRIYAAHAHNHAAQIDRLREALKAGDGDEGTCLRRGNEG
jgi:hypothetical protein